MAAATRRSCTVLALLSCTAVAVPERSVAGDGGDDGGGGIPPAVFDHDGDGLIDTIAGEPQSLPSGRVVISWGDGSAETPVYAPEDSVEQFGLAIAPFVDLDGDGAPELRVLSLVRDADGHSAWRTWFVADGVPLFAITTDLPELLWAPQPGDVNDDGFTDAEDLAWILAHLGETVDEAISGRLLRDPILVDPSGDGVVESDDLAAAMSNLGGGIAGFQPGWYTPGGGRPSNPWLLPGPGGGAWYVNPCDGSLWWAPAQHGYAFDCAGSGDPTQPGGGGAGGASGTGPIDPTPPETHPAPGEGDCEIAIRPCLGGGLPKYVCVGSEICFRAMLGDPQWPQYHWTVAGPASIVGPDSQQSVVVRIDGVGEVTITVSRGCATSITVFAVTLDLDVDSDNDDALASPDRSEVEEQMEQAAPGKLLFAALGSADGDAVPDFADGMNLWSDASDDDACAGLALVPVALSVSPLPGDAKLVFDYDASDPAGVVRQSVGSGPGADVLYEPAPGTLRLWRGSGASGGRDARSLLEGGDYIPGGVPIPATLVLAAIEAHGTLFLEAVQRSATASGTSIRASLATPDSSEPPSCATDSVVTTAIALEIHDLREWGPTLTAEGTLRLAKGDLRDGATQAPVRGAITDGASICLLRSEPPVDLTLLGSHVAIIRRGDTAPLAPSIVGSMHETATTAGGLPALPIQHQAPSGQSASAPLGAGVALFVPPESYVDPNFTTGASFLNGLETCPMEFVVQSGVQRGGAAVVVGRTPFVLRRPPIVLVHGILSSPATWDPGLWNEDAGQAHQTRLYYADWSDPKLRSKGFSEGYPTVALAIEKALVEYRTANDAGHHWSRGFRGVRYAATRADVVGHSQGAQLARFYIADGMPASADRVGWVGDLLNQRNDAGSDGRWNYLRAANWWAGSIRRLIALGSPFRGSPLANTAAPIFAPGESGAPASPGFSALMLWRLSGDFPPALESLLFPDGPDAYCEPSCVADLCQGSTAGSMLGAATYPSTHRRTRWFPVVGIASQPAGEVVVEPILWELLFSWIPWIPGDPTELSPLDPTNSDLIVSRSSQRNSSGADTHANAFAGEQFSLTTHVSLGSVPAETTSQSIRNRVAELLGQLPTSFDPSWSLGS